jgi:cytochrome c2
VLGASGPLGSGDAGPNLSGLFTPSYPRTARGEAAWTEAALADWLANPRGVRPWTTMPPVRLEEAERRRIAGELGWPEAPPPP